MCQRVPTESFCRQKVASLLRNLYLIQTNPIIICAIYLQLALLTWMKVSEAVQSQTLNIETNLELQRDCLH